MTEASNIEISNKNQPESITLIGKQVLCTHPESDYLSGITGRLFIV